MAVIDQELEMARGQSAIAVVGNLDSTHSIDLGAPGTPVGGAAALIRNPGRWGKRLELVVQVLTQILSAAGAATVKAQLITGTGVDANGQINAGLVVLQETAAVAKALLVAGYRWQLQLPASGFLRYVAVRLVIGTADVSAGTWEAALVLDAQTDPTKA